MAHRTYKVEESDQAKAVLTHDVIEGTITAVDFNAKTIDVDLDAPYKPRSVGTTHWGRLQDKGYESLPSTPVFNSLSDVDIIYNCETTSENPAGAFKVGEKVLIMAIGTDFKAVGFPDEVKPCISTIYIRPTIDGKPLVCGGQQFSVSYKKEGEVDWTDTAPRPIYGTWGTPDPRKHGVCGPFVLEDWDRGGIRVNLLKARDVDAWRGNTSTDKADSYGVTTQTPINGDDPPFGSGQQKETKNWTGLQSMFFYVVEDTESGEYFDYLLNNTAVDSLGEKFDNGSSCLGKLCPRSGGSVQEIAWCRIQKLGLADTDPTSPDELVLQKTTKKWRIAERIYLTISGSQLIGSLEVQAVWDYEAEEEIQAQVWEHNFVFQLKQRRIKRQVYAYKQHVFTFQPLTSSGYGRFPSEVLWSRAVAEFFTNGQQPTFDMMWWTFNGGGWTEDNVGRACWNICGVRWLGLVGIDAVFGGSTWYNGVDYEGDIDVLALQQSMISISGEGSPGSQSFPPAGSYIIEQPRNRPKISPSTECETFDPLQFPFEAEMASMDDRWF
jgi:hypothetical protein